MADPFSAFASAAGVTGLAMHSVKSLIYDIEGIKNAPDLIQALKQDLVALSHVLQALEAGTEGPSLQHLNTEAKSALATTLDNCRRACNKFQTKLEKWTRHSKNDKVQWWDRVRVGFFVEGDIESLRKQLEQCKATISTAIGTMNLLMSVRSVKMTEEIKNTLLTREAEITHAMTSTNHEIADVATCIEQMGISDHAANSPQRASDTAEVVEVLEAERASLQSAHVVLENLLSETRFLRTGQRVRDVDMSNGGQLLVGLFNAQGKPGQIQQDISNIKANTNGKGVVGIAEGLDINAFFKQ